jgi:hypothetical protein
MESLNSLLKFLEETLDPERIQISEKCHQQALTWEPVDRLPLIVSYPFPKSSSIQPFPHGEIFDHPEKMLFNELVYAFDTSIFLHSELQDNLSLTIRANFGTVVIASLFGGRVEQRENNPPWIRHFETKEQFNSIFDKDPLDFSQGICPNITERYRFYCDILSDYPNLQKCIKIVLPDLQGPLDSLELLRGSEIYSDFILDPELVENGLRLMSKAQVGFARYLKPMISDDSDGFSHQHAVAMKGNILIRNDSAIMVSPEMYAEQVAPHDKYVLKELGGGGIHSCGRIDFNIPAIFKLESIRCFDFGQSYLNDVDAVYPLAQTLKIPLLRFRPTKEELISGKILERFPTGVALVFEAKSYEEALVVMSKYQNR